MAESVQSTQTPQATVLEGGTYEIIRGRLLAHGAALRERLEWLNEQRKDVFGSIELVLQASERISTDNNCIPRDIVQIGERVLFGYNVFVGLRAQTTLEDVFGVYERRDGHFVQCDLSLLDDERFHTDFRNLYKYYRQTFFAKFAVLGPHLYMAFRVGKDVTDIKTFKWLIRDGRLEYVDNRSDHEYVFPPQHEFEWKRVTQDTHRRGLHPHISIEDRLFVETLGGDLTIKIEDNTTSGEGIYSEPVDDPDQTLNDAEIHYAIVGNIILLRIRPYQEKNYRYIVYNEKIQQAVRIDSIADACVLLPDGHGLIFPRGCYLQSGERKTFETDTRGMIFDKRIASPNGEDFLYVFYNRQSGSYVLLAYNLIAQQLANPILCSGYALREEGTLLYFRASDEPQKHHAVQIWQTPFCGPDYQMPVQSDSHLYRIGNRDIVRCMAECTELIHLLGREDTYVNLYLDIARKATDIRDSYFWLDSQQTGQLGEPLEQIRLAATSGMEEYEKVVRTRRNTREQVQRIAAGIRDLINSINYYTLAHVNEFVRLLAELRKARGEAIALRDLRYVDLELVEALEAEVADHAERLGAACVEFLLKPEAMVPYSQRVEELAVAVPALGKVADARELAGAVTVTDSELELLTEIVANLKIDDATQTTEIIEAISLVYARLNQVKSALKNRTDELAATEGRAEFGAQIKLLEQAAVNFLDVADTPAKCDEYLTRAMVQLEGIESRFADFDEFVDQLAQKREDLYAAFESRKLALQERRNRRATALMSAAERVLKGIHNRVGQMTSLSEINGYLAGDLMVERLRETIRELRDLGDNVKAEDLESRLKTLQQDAVRQLKDRQALYEDGDNVIRLGKHRFGVNHQPLELTIIQRDGRMFYHLTGTGFFEPLADEEFLATRDVWELDTVSETPQVYRAEYLAWQMLRQIATGQDADAALSRLAVEPLEAIVPRVQAFMSPRYAEGYNKGVHDQDGAKILHALAKLTTSIGLLRYASGPRAMATLFWRSWTDATRRDLLTAKLDGIGRMRQLFTANGAHEAYVAELADLLSDFVSTSGGLFDPQAVPEAAEYLFCELTTGGRFAICRQAADLAGRFGSHLRANRYAKPFDTARHALASDPLTAFGLVRDWVGSYLRQHEKPAALEYAEEIALAIQAGQDARPPVIDAQLAVELTDLSGSHRRIEQGRLVLHYNDFTRRLSHHARQVVPLFERFTSLKKRLVDSAAEQLRLDEFRPRVLTTFVRNRLLDRVYLPLIGDNIAKQIGSAGDTKRTDRQGLLLLISPPGYGKTTLMEYVANRLGLIFMKINGPAVGHRVTSFDPAEAPNAAAREELAKLNLALEMGDNVMLYLDDIQHCHPELLQKFISLCDAQRRVEGVYKGRTRTYDLRGKRVAVVMAGNPYTESGEKFRIPDMLANRADTYNIGDIVGDNFDEFVDSYVENALTSNPVLEKLANRSQQDVYSVMKLARTGQREGIDFEGNYAPDELNEYVAVMQKLYTVREVVLKVNQEYIRSAGQEDAYRTEPPFLLQGSYRNMNRIAARVLPVMNDRELWTVIESAYEQDAQTLTTGAEANLLKFREMVGRLTDKQAARWDEIKRTFNRNKLLGGPEEDQVAQVVRQLNAFGEGLDGIRRTIVEAASQRDGNGQAQLGERLGQFAGALEGIRATLGEGLASMSAGGGGDDLRELSRDVLGRMNELVAVLRERPLADPHRDVTTLTGVLEEQFRAMETWLTPVVRTDQGRREYVEQLIQRFEGMVDGYRRLSDILRRSRPEDVAHPGPRVEGDADADEADPDGAPDA